MIGRLAMLAMAAAVSCGGRTGIAPVGPDSGLSGSVSDSGVCSATGTRICGEECGLLSDCPACTRLYDTEAGASAYGICWGDLLDKGTTPCALCDEGQGCVRRDLNTFVCVPLGVCSALRALEAGSVCWYGDKVPFDGREVGANQGCADDSTGVVCGGGCPACAQNTLARCVGTGPDHPFGICPALALTSANPGDVGSYPRCELTVGGAQAVPCPSDPAYPYSCAISPYPPGDVLVARMNGYCLNADLCKSLSAAIPGGIWCFDAAGTRVAP